MFTGIIEHIGRVTRLDTTDFGARLVVDAGNLAQRVKRGDSVAVHGVCLTVAGSTGPAGELTFDVISQTLRRTALGDLTVGDGVHLERAATPETMLGGHLVQGHVDAVGTVVDVREQAEDRRLRVQPNCNATNNGDDPMDCIVKQGSIAINGVSLTVADAGRHWFEVALIPTTRTLTVLGNLQNGDRVNLETDYIAKIVIHWLRRHRSDGRDH